MVMLHGYGANHANALSGMSPAQALALRVNGRAAPPIALVTADGGGGYWNPHPGDNPQAMLTDELIPMCRRLGLGTARGGEARRIGVMGISMGGYGSLLLAEQGPDLINAVAAISPAIWTSYAQARAANAGAYASAADFSSRRRGDARRRAHPRPGPRRLRLRPTPSTPASRPSPARCPRTPAASPRP